MLNSSKITAVFVVDAGTPVGIVHLHDLLRAGVAYASSSTPVPPPASRASARTTLRGCRRAVRPGHRQIVSSIFTVPLPATIGFSSVNSRPTKASARRLRNG